MNMTLTINGRDYSQRISTYTASREITYRKVITTLDDAEHAYPATPRPTLTFSLWPMHDAQERQFYDDLSALIISVTYTDPHDGAGTVTRNMRVVSNIDVAFALDSIDGHRYYKGGEITLRAVM